MSGVSIDLVEDRASFEALAPEWRALYERSGRPDQIFQRFDWLRLWADQFLDSADRLAIVIGRRAGRLVMVWPLVLTRSLGVLRLAFMGEPAGQYGDALIENSADAAIIEAGWKRILTLKADVIHLRRIRESSTLFAFLRERALATAPDVAPYVEFGDVECYEDFDSRYSSKARSSRRRLRRRLEEIGSVAFVSAKSCDEARVLIGKGFAMKRAQLAESGRLSPAMRDRRLERLFVAAAGVPEAGAQITAIECGGETIAVSVAFAASSEAFGHILAHDIRFEKQGVGVLLAEHAFRSSFAAGCKRFDMAPPSDHYKMDWASGVIRVDDFAIPLTVSGELYARLWLKGGRAMAKAVAGRMPAGLLRALNR